MLIFTTTKFLSKAFSCFITGLQKPQKPAAEVTGSWQGASAYKVVFVQVSLPALHLDSKSESLNLSFNKNSPFRPRFSPCLA